MFSPGVAARPRCRPATSQPKDRAATWLRNAMIALGLLAFCAAAVSWTAQYRLVFDVKQLSVIAALEAAIPDAAAFIFASLGIALALHGQRAIRPRVLNVAAVVVSMFMNAIAAAPGWRDLAVWVMPAVAYAVASDTLIGVIRAWALARARALDTRLADDEATPLTVIGGLVLWLLRLILAPRSTLAGFRRWVVDGAGPRPGWSRWPSRSSSGSARRPGRRSTWASRNPRPLGRDGLAEMGQPR